MRKNILMTCALLILFASCSMPASPENKPDQEVQTSMAEKNAYSFKSSQAIDIDDSTAEIWFEESKEDEIFETIEGQFEQYGAKIHSSKIIQDEEDPSLARMALTIENPSKNDLIFYPSSVLIAYGIAEPNGLIEEKEPVIIESGQAYADILTFKLDYDIKDDYPYFLGVLQLGPDLETLEENFELNKVVGGVVDKSDGGISNTSVSDLNQAYTVLAKSLYPDDEKLARYLNDEDLIDYPDYIKENWDEARAQMTNIKPLIAGNFENNGITITLTEAITDVLDDDRQFALITRYSLDNMSDSEIIFDPKAVEVYSLHTKETISPYKNEDLIPMNIPQGYFLMEVAAFAGEEVDVPNREFIYVFPEIKDINNNIVMEKTYIHYYLDKNIVPTYEQISKEEAMDLLK